MGGLFDNSFSGAPGVELDKRIGEYQQRGAYILTKLNSLFYNRIGKEYLSSINIMPIYY